MNSSGWIVTSKNCSGLRRIFLSARQAIESVWLTVSAGLVRERRARDRGGGVDGDALRCSSGHLQDGLVDFVGSRRGSGSVSWPVSARKTSSSVGLATLTEAIADARLAQGDQHVGRPVGVVERRR